MKIETTGSRQRDALAAAGENPPPFVSAAAPPGNGGNGWVICVTDAGSLADGNPGYAAARAANGAFLQACEAYEGLSADRRLAHALLTANEYLDGWWKDRRRERVGVALTAVALNDDGADYIAVGDGTVAVFDDAEVTIVRRGLHDRTGEAGLRAGLRGHAMHPECAERGRYPVPPNPKGVVVIGTGLLGCLDEDAFGWTASMKLKPQQLVRALVDAVTDQTRNRRPGVHVTAAADW